MTSSGIVFIVLIACITGIAMRYITEKNKRPEGDDTALEETLAQLEAVEARVRVLERIITENKIDLKREIERL